MVGLKRDPERRLPGRWAYALGAAGLSVAIPFGLLALRLLLDGRSPEELPVRAELRQDPLLYGYLLLSLLLTLVPLGFRLGRNEERRASSLLIDELTRLASRPELFDSLEEQSARASRDGRPLTLLVIELRGLEALGKARGDHVAAAALLGAADALRLACRGADLPARSGPAELALMVPELQAEQTLALAERLRRALAELPLRPLDARIGIADLRRAARPGAMGLYEAAVSAARAAAATRQRIGLAPLQSSGREAVSVAGRPVARGAVTLHLIEGGLDR